jgi:hypothetical protein
MGLGSLLMFGHLIREKYIASKAHKYALAAGLAPERAVSA